MRQSNQSFLQGPYSVGLIEAATNDVKSVAYAAYCFPCAAANVLQKANPQGTNPPWCVICCFGCYPLWTICADRETKKACKLPEEQSTVAPCIKALCCAPCFIAQQTAELDRKDRKSTKSPKKSTKSSKKSSSKQ